MVIQKRWMIMGLASTLFVGVSCRSHYHLKSVERTRMLIDRSYDAQPDAAAVAYLAPYKERVDSMMSPVVGTVAHDMIADRPESPLSNLLSDVLMWAAAAYGEHPDFAVYNIGGMRASFIAGNVTVGDVLEVAPFENRISFLTLTGDRVLELFQQIGWQHGEGVSHAVRLVFSKDWQLKSAQVNGKDIVAEHKYRIVTLDYVAQGNDNMTAFKYGTDKNQPEEATNNVRNIIMNYLREKQKQGVVVKSEIEGRIKIE